MLDPVSRQSLGFGYVIEQQKERPFEERLPPLVWGLFVDLWLPSRDSLGYNGMKTYIVM